MYSHRVFLLTLALSGGFVLVVPASDAAAPRLPYCVSFMVFRGDPLGNVEDGTVKMLDGGQYDLEPGKPFTRPTPNPTQIMNDGFVRPGYWVHFTAQPEEDGRIRVEMALEYTSAVEKAEDREVLHTVRTRKAIQLRPDQTWRFRLGERSVQGVIDNRG